MMLRQELNAAAKQLTGRDMDDLGSMSLGDLKRLRIVTNFVTDMCREELEYRDEPEP